MTPGSTVRYLGENDDLRRRARLFVVGYTVDPEHGSFLVVVGGEDGPTWAVEPDQLLEAPPSHSEASP